MLFLLHGGLSLTERMNNLVNVSLLFSFGILQTHLGPQEFSILRLPQNSSVANNRTERRTFLSFLFL